MEILIFTYDDIKNPNYGGGGAIAIHKMAKALSGKNNVTIISWDHSGKKKEIIDGISYERFGAKWINPKIAMFLYQIALPYFAITKRADILIESFGPPFTTALLPIFTRKKIIGIAHMLASEDMKRKYKLPIFGAIEKFGIRRYKNIITTSSHLKSTIGKITPESKITVISNGIEKVNYKKTKKINQILFLGRIEVDQKGLDLLIKTFSKMDNNKNTKLIIAGSGMKNEMEKLKKIINKSDAKNNIKMIGKVEGIKKEKLLSESLCVVIPSRFETYSMVALEAMSHGLPIICFDINGLKWIPKNSAIKIKSFDTKKMAIAISELISDKKRLTEISKRQKEYAAKFTWKEISKQYQKYINNL